MKTDPVSRGRIGKPLVDGVQRGSHRRSRQHEHVGLAADVAADGDDDAALLFAHHRDRRRDQAQGGEEFQFKAVAPGVLLQGQRIAAAGGSRAVDQAVDVQEAPAHLLHDPVGRIGRIHVAGDDLHVGGQLTGECLEGGRVARDQREPGALGRQQPRSRRADAAAGAGDDDDPVLEF